MSRKGLTGGTVLALLGLFVAPPIAHGEEILEDVILIIRDKEIVAFSSAGNQWVSMTLRAQERVVQSEFTSQVAVVVTNQRAMGFSAITNRWSEIKIDVGEQVLELEAEGLVSSVNTNFRALGFGARKGEWAEYRYRYR
jgi:hypothetical protein